MYKFTYWAATTSEAIAFLKTQGLEPVDKFGFGWRCPFGGDSMASISWNLNRNKYQVLYYTSEPFTIH